MASDGGTFFVECEGDIAMGASWYPSALSAFDEAGESSAILEKDDLFFSFEGFLHDFDEAWRESTFHELFTFGFFCVNDLYCRKLHIAESVRELHISVAFFACQMIHLETGRGSA